MNNSVEAYADLMEKWMSAFDEAQPYPNILAEFMVAPRREGWKALITFHTCVIPGARRILDGQAALGASGVFCTVVVKDESGFIDKSGGFSICNDGDEWSDVVGMRVALKNALDQYDRYSSLHFIRLIWRSFVRNVVQKEAKLIE